MANRNVVDILIRARDEATAVIKKATREVESSARQTRASFQSLVAPSTLATTAIAGMATAAAGAGIAAVRLAGQLEQAEIAFGTMLGSGEEAKAFLDDLADFAAATPFEFQGLQNSARLLLAFGFEAKAVLPIVGALGDATSALGGGTDVLEGVIRALGQIQTKGKVSTEELLQLAERGIPVFDILREKLNLTSEQVADIGRQGISSSEAITAILEGLGERFGGAMEAQSRTLLGLWSTVLDTVSLTAMDVGTKINEALDLTGALEWAVEQLERFRQWVSELDLRKAFDEGRDAIELMAGAIIATMLPSLIALAAQILRVMRPIAAMAIAGALVVDVAKQLGVDFGELIKPNGVLPRVGSVATGLADIFKGISTSIAMVIRASIEGIAGWVTFFELAIGQVSDLINHLVTMAAKSQEVQDNLKAGRLGAAWGSVQDLNELRTQTPGINLGAAWNQAFPGTDAEILAGFDTANALLTQGWEKIAAGFSGNVDETVNTVVNGVAESVTTAAAELIDWAQLLGTNVEQPLKDLTGTATEASKAVDKVTKAALADQMNSAEVGGPSAGMDTGMSPGAIKYRLQKTRERAAAEAQAVFDSYLELMRDTSRLEAMAAAEVGGPSAGMDTGMSPGAIRVRLQQVKDRAAAEAQAVFDAYLELMQDTERLEAMAAAEVAGPDMSGGLSPEQVAARLKAGKARADREAAAAFDAYLELMQDTERLEAMAAAEVSGPDMGSPLSPAAVRVRLQQVKDRADAEAQAVFDAYLDLMQDTSRLEAMAAAEVGGPSAGMSTGLSAGNLRARLASNRRARSVDRAAEIDGPRTDRIRFDDWSLASDFERAAMAAQVLEEKIRLELEARRELIDQLTTITADKGPLGNFGASLLGLAADTIPAVSSALEGFVQGGPMGAVVAVFNQLLGESEAFAKFLEDVNLALEPLVRLIGTILSPAFNLLATVLTGVVDTIVAVWNFLFGWLGLGVDPSRGPKDQPREPDTFRHSADPFVDGEVSFSGVGSGVQLAVATPLMEAATLSMAASTNNLLASNTLLQAAQLIGQYFEVLTERGIYVNSGTPAPAMAGGANLYSRAAIVRG